MPTTPNKPTTSDWARVQQDAAQNAPIAYTASDGPYDPNDAAAVAAYWQQASVKRGRGRPSASIKRPTLNMRVDPDVLDAFKATGRGWQTRINAALREAVNKGL